MTHLCCTFLITLLPQPLLPISSSGLVQVLTDALSLDAIKKTPGYTNLPQYFKKTFGTSPERLLAAKRNFAASLAAYSLFR